VLKNYDGQNLGEFLDHTKKTKAIKVGEDGEAKREVQEIPFEAKQAFATDIKRDIYEKSMSVDTNNITGNVTNVQIRSMYAGLDLKATKFERNTTEFLGDLMFFYGYEADDLNIVYDRNLVINEVEMATLANQSRGFIRVENVQAEIERMDKMSDPESDLV